VFLEEFAPLLSLVLKGQQRNVASKKQKASTTENFVAASRSQILNQNFCLHIEDTKKI